MTQIGRRQFCALAGALGAEAAWAASKPSRSRRSPQERRDLYPEGVASADPDARSVLLWTRRPFVRATHARLRVEVAEDPAFSRVIARANTRVSAASDWTCRVLVGGLRPARVYWYRFIDEDGFASRIGRTLTAPADDDGRPVRFAFVSCQNVNLGEQHAYRRMLFEDERAPESERLGFVLHLGDFVYETIWYPEDRPQGIHGRKVRGILRYPNGAKVGDQQIPTTLEDYRALYRTYLHDEDIQDARARWPFVCIWDNHEFSQSGWQSMQVLQGSTRAAQSLKVMANQAWFEYQPARVRKSSGDSLAAFDAPLVKDGAVLSFDAHGLGQEPNNLAALASLTAYRSIKWGRHVELLVTDQRSYRSERPASRPEAKSLWPTPFPRCIPQEVLEVLDAGWAYGGGNPPANIRVGDVEVPNFRKDQPPQTLLGAAQKQWFLQRLKASAATWKIWGCSTGTLDRRIDLQNLPPGILSPWPGKGFATFEDGDHGSAYVERREIYEAVRDRKVTGFATVCGDRHSFWAGFAAPGLPPQPFEPVGVAFVTASISMPSSADLLDAGLPPEHPLRPLFFGSRGEQPPRSPPVANMLLRHGVRSCLEYNMNGDLGRARELSNPELSPHLKFLDFAGYGYATVRASADALDCEFVCIPTPLERSSDPAGAPIVYRVLHRAPLWRAGEYPRLEQRILEGNPALSL